MSYRRPVANYAAASASASTSGGGYGAGAESSLMQQNDDHVDLMSQKVNILKEISLQIGDEVNHQNSMLRDMEQDFDKSGDVIGQTMKRLTAIAKSPNGFWMCWLIAFVALVLFYIVFVHRRL
ncbi:hypothetical protein BC830DRAFT_1096133 [Chytriomyces sp. MP71]|nr:hypothetical protein BC830DRAFT_1096133 [Chytriomyces sp. MP71]